MSLESRIKNAVKRGMWKVVTPVLIGTLLLGSPVSTIPKTPIETVSENSLKEYEINIERPDESVFQAFSKIMPGDLVGAYFAAQQAKQANNWHRQLPVGSYRVFINENVSEEQLQKREFNPEARETQQEYTLDWHLQKSREKERIEDAIHRISGFNGKLLYYALEEFNADKETLNPEPGLYFVYFNEDNLQQRLDEHYSKVFKKDVSFDVHAPPKKAKKVWGWVTKYYRPRQSDFRSYGSFRSAVRMEGSGILNDGRILRYNGRIADPKKGQAGVNGTTANGTNPIPLGTIAAPSWLKKGKIVYLEFAQVHPCNGWYRADDRGSAIRGKHFDIFAGVGKSSLYKVGRFINTKDKVVVYIP